MWCGHDTPDHFAMTLDDATRVILSLAVEVATLIAVATAVFAATDRPMWPVHNASVTFTGPSLHAYHEPSRLLAYRRPRLGGIMVTTSEFRPSPER
jgi:hypothetical protein